MIGIFSCEAIQTVMSITKYTSVVCIFCFSTSRAESVNTHPHIEKSSDNDDDDADGDGDNGDNADGNMEAERSRPYLSRLKRPTLVYNI